MLAMSAPLNTTRPEVGTVSPEMQPASVVLPDPVSPTTETTSPAATVKETSWTASTTLDFVPSPADVVNRLLMCSTLKTGAPAASTVSPGAICSAILIVRQDGDSLAGHDVSLVEASHRVNGAHRQELRALFALGPR